MENLKFMASFIDDNNEIIRKKYIHNKTTIGDIMNMQNDLWVDINLNDLPITCELELKNIEESETLALSYNFWLFGPEEVDKNWKKIYDLINDLKDDKKVIKEIFERKEFDLIEVDEKWGENLNEKVILVHNWWDGVELKVKIFYEALSNNTKSIELSTLYSYALKMSALLIERIKKSFIETEINNNSEEIELEEEFYHIKKIKLLIDVKWTFSSKIFENIAAFSEEINNYNHNNKKWQPDKVVFDYSKLKIKYFAWIHNSEDPCILINEVINKNYSLKNKEENCYKMNFIATLETENNMCFTAIELMYKIHQQLANKNLGNYIFYAGFVNTNTNNTDDVPCYLLANGC